MRLTSKNAYPSRSPINRPPGRESIGMIRVPTMPRHTGTNILKVGSIQMSLSNHQNFRSGTRTTTLSLRTPSGNICMGNAQGALPSGSRAHPPIANTSGFRVHPQASGSGSTPEPVVLGPTTRLVVLGPTPEPVVLGPTPPHQLLPARPPCTRVGNDRVSRKRPNVLRQHPGFLQKQLGAGKGSWGSEPGPSTLGSWGVVGGPAQNSFPDSSSGFCSSKSPQCSLESRPCCLRIEPSLLLGVLRDALHIYHRSLHQLPELAPATC